MILHDSLGFGINAGIMSKQQLKTVKTTCFKLDHVAAEITKLKASSHRPKALVIHSGTNDLKDGASAEDIIRKYEEIIQDVNANILGTKVVVSTIVPREDSRKLQRNVEYINAYLNRKYGDSEEATIVMNNDIRGYRYKKRDGVHLKEDGSSRLGSHLNKGIKRALNIKE